MSHDKIGPHELRLRELRDERARKTSRRVGITNAPKPLVRGARHSPNTKRATKGKTT